MATPLGKSGYLFSRIGLPTVVSFVYCLVVGSLFSLTDISFGTLFCLSSLSGVMSVISALLAVSLLWGALLGRRFSRKLFV